MILETLLLCAGSVVVYPYPLVYCSSEHHMISAFPPTVDIIDKGSFYLGEFDFEDGCERIKTFPSVIITRPIRKAIPSTDCKPAALKYTEWSSSLQRLHPNQVLTSTA